ncbi:hypothetical protein [Methylobacterium gossipiicola]|uniref:Uncharacterized protein n=1 Tax=Methylobacterium gossipiicola TaxID=582675 RepID=A0A1I2WW05_9HYPH|nr:hypothetical protein [Methylobacterium gossipiicola]SFH04799.1 hypothetical protein SAMN05192565_12735 [Methylobacterium gossipiicola]
MEQGTRLDSTRMSAAQDIRDDAGEDHALDAAVAALLTAPSAKADAPEPDHELLRLGVEFDAAHAAWLDAVEANREPTERFTAFIDAAKATGGPTIKELEAAWALPGVTEANHRDDEAFAVVTDLGLEILKMPATSLAGLAVHARAVIPNVWVLGDYEQDAELGDREDLPEKPVRALIQSALSLAGVDWKGRPAASPLSVAVTPPPAPSSEPEVDWDKPPEGFMAYPAGEPTSFINIALGIRVEAERLHAIALREVARRASADDCPEYARAGRLDQLRRRFRVAELDRVANPERAIPTEMIAANGTVYYEDAAGKAHRRPVTDWISFMAQRMAGVARREMARQFNAGAVQDQDANGAFYDDLRCSHRLDALHDLAFRPNKVFEAARECAVGSAPLSPRVVGAPTPDPILDLIERHRQAYAEWVPFMEVTTELVDGTPEYARAEADESGPKDRERAAYAMVLTARPISLAGLIAWASYLPQALASNSVDPDEDGSQALASLCDAVLSLVPITASHPAEHPDAALIALGVELEAADARMKVADADCDARADVVFAAMPERPSALVFRESDRPFNLQCDGRYIADLEGTPIDRGDIEWMTRRPACHEIKRPVRPGERAWHDFPGHVLDVVPWPEAQARIDEIVSTWKAWDSAKDAVNEAHGLLEAEARCTAADSALKSVLDRMAALPARTVEGMHIKLRAFQDAVPHMRGANWGELMLRSLMRDAGVALPEMEA